MTTAKIVPIVLIVHIFFGAFGLTAGTLALFINKTLKLHKIAGKVFFYSMLGIFLTSIYMSLVSGNLFLLLVGFFSFYLAATGYRILFLKRLHVAIIKPKLLDYLIVATGVISGIAIIGLGVFLFSKGNMFWVVSCSFGLVSIGLGYKDAIKFKHPPTDKTHWIKSHASRMAGAYTATVTAFIVVNIQMANGWILWILPALIIIPTSQKIVNKFLAPHKKSI
ncbi:hypothetical protein [Flavobacterium sp.]|jgi:hypothetical protein|uniref:hypothetical protein n=1 Tax=Flavobacterium sp. TaxID=239 RepID=UPI0037C0708A